MPTLCLVADGCAKSALSSEPQWARPIWRNGRLCNRPTSRYNAALSLRLSPYQLLHFALLRAASVLAWLQWLFRLALLAGCAFGFLAFFPAECGGICHECVIQSL